MTSVSGQCERFPLFCVYLLTYHFQVLTSDPVYQARAAALAAGIPDTVPIQCINRFCSSGLMSVTAIANQIRTGSIEIGLALGVESMSEKYVPNILKCSRTLMPRNVAPTKVVQCSAS